MESIKLMVLVMTIGLTLGSITLPYVMEPAEADEDNDEVKLNISSTDGGSVFEPGEGTFTFEEWENITLKALPWDTVYGSESLNEADYQFENWTVDENILEDNSSEITHIKEENMDPGEEYDIIAEFSPQFELYSYNLTIDIDGEGSTDPSAEEHVFYFTEEEGEEVKVEADPADGWEFDEWSGDHTGTSEEIRISIDDDKELTAHFQEEGDENWMWIIGIGVFLVIVMAIALDATKKDD